MKPVELTDLYQYKFLSSPSYSPSGSAFAFVHSSCDTDDNKYNSNIWIYENNQFRQLTAMSNERSFLWDNDETLLFPAVRSKEDKKRQEEKEQFTTYYRIPIHGGEALKAFTIPLSVSSIKKISDGKYFILGNVDLQYPEYYKMTKEERDKVHKDYKDETDYEVLDEIPFWMNGGSYMNKTRTNPFIYDEATGECTPIMAPNFNVSSYALLDDTIYITGEHYNTKPCNKDEIYKYDISQQRLTCIDDSKTYSIHSLEPLGNDIFMAASKNERFGLNENPCIYKINGVTDEITLLSDYDNSIRSSVGSDCRYGGGAQIRSHEGKVYFVTTKRNSSHLYSIDANGTITPIIEKEGSIDSFDIAGDTITLVGLYGKSLQELYAYNLADGTFSVLSHFNDENTADRYIADYEKINFQGSTTDIDGWVLKPINYDESKTYPAILDIHGGPKTVYGEVFYHEMQYWASQGYFVFFCNPEGSDGRGNAFSDIRGKYGTIDYETLMTFTDEVLSKYPQIDETRVAVTGGSYGGFMTNWIIGHTDRFACAATQRSISNWISMYGISDIGTYFTIDQQGADLYDNADKLWFHSPLKYAANMNTPTLVIHSDQDYRCPIAEGLQLFTTLVNKGVPARMCCFHGENHELSRSGKPLHRERRLKEITNWIKEYTK